MPGQPHTGVTTGSAASATGAGPRKEECLLRRRLLVCGAFGAAGLAAALPISERFGFDTVLAFIGCTLGGVAIGYVLGIFLDVFLGSPSGTES